TTAMLPDSTADAVARHHTWLRPHFWDEGTNDVGSRIQSFVVKTPRTTVLIDTCVGNDKNREGSALWHMRRGTFLDDLAAAGVTPAGVVVSVGPHRPADHVGWTPRLVAGRGMPPFPRAAYLIPGEEGEYWRHEKEECIADSAVPIVGAGRATLVDARHTI